jgi:hypothetical protein
VSDLTFLQSWYLSQCDEDWEHEYGVKIATLDNPGWRVQVDLIGTALEGRVVARSKLEPAADRWIWSWSDGEVFHATCDAMSLDLALSLFRAFVEGA